MRLRLVSCWRLLPVEKKKTSFILRSIIKCKFTISNKTRKLRRRQCWSSNIKSILILLLLVRTALFDLFWMKSAKIRSKSTSLGGVHSAKKKRKKLKREKLLGLKISMRSNCTSLTGFWLLKSLKKHKVRCMTFSGNWQEEVRRHMFLCSISAPKK